MKDVRDVNWSNKDVRDVNWSKEKAHAVLLGYHIL